ncbi:MULTISPECIES: hypothetical protein [Paenibacillus]|uniref:hypothetical protein n=1 Tax=Paenibacillus TaxID=44249 RepID=UPI001162C72D|nr:MULTISPECIES: hypothetical protein [Paenibacillus]AWP25214.1 hypothetical protein B9D94_00595 [Paenibacillus sp. Cedars]MBX4152613.1 hypothetical protein [Paenibacillus lautus]MCT1402891.1 hypothetical protein [Paenibacillus sp. p3-SID867]
MSKNKKVVLVSVGVLLLLIASVILFRSPTKETIPEPTSQEVHTEVSDPVGSTTHSGEYQESHERVAKVIDDAKHAISERAPGWWDKIESWWGWFLGFKTEHAIIIALVAFFLIGIVFNPKNRDQSRHR